MNQPKWADNSYAGKLNATGKYGRWNMISVWSHPEPGWNISWSRSHVSILSGRSISFEQTKLDSVNALEEFLRKTFGL
jgi:hypothetical protein